MGTGSGSAISGSSGWWARRITSRRSKLAHTRRADIRADIYSLGCTLYYLLAGQVPFPRGSVTEKLAAHVKQTARPLAELRGDVPAAVAGVMARMMAKEPGQRFQTPAEVAERWQASQMKPSRPANYPRRLNLARKRKIARVPGRLLIY